MPKIPASERDAFYEARRTELAQVALRLWAERGFEKTSVAAIAEEAGVAKGTFYLYFASKDALLADVFRRNSLLPNVTELIEALQHEPLESAVRGFVAGAWRHLADNRALVLVVLRELPAQLDRAQALLARVMLPTNEALAGYLERRIDPEHHKDISFIIAARSLMGMVLFTFLTQEILGAKRVFPVPEAQIVETLTEMFLRGVVGEDCAYAATPAPLGGADVTSDEIARASTSTPASNSASNSKTTRPLRPQEPTSS